MSRTHRPRLRAAWLGSFACLLGAALCFSGCGGVALAAWETELKRGSQKKTGHSHAQQVVPSTPGTARLRWTPPTHRVNGEPIGADLAGYKLYRGSRSRYYDTVIDIPDPLTTDYTLDSLPPGTHYFAVSAYDTQGRESGYSNEASKQVQ